MRIKVLSGGRKNIELSLSDAELNFQMRRIGIEETVPMCRLVEVSEKDNPLHRFEGQTVNMDEVNFFAKRMESLTEYERKVLSAYAEDYGVATMKDLINLTFSMKGLSLLTDFSDTEETGQVQKETESTEETKELIIETETENGVESGKQEIQQTPEKTEDEKPEEPPALTEDADTTKLDTPPEYEEPEGTKPLVDDTPKTGDTKDGMIYIEGFGWVVDNGGGGSGTVADDMYENGNKVGMQGLSFGITIIPPITEEHISLLCGCRMVPIRSTHTYWTAGRRMECSV